MSGIVMEMTVSCLLEFPFQGRASFIVYVHKLNSGTGKPYGAIEVTEVMSSFAFNLSVNFCFLTFSFCMSNSCLLRG